MSPQIERHDSANVDHGGGRRVLSAGNGWLPIGSLLVMSALVACQRAEPEQQGKQDQSVASKSRTDSADTRRDVNAPPATEGTTPNATTVEASSAESPPDGTAHAPPPAPPKFEDGPEALLTWQKLLHKNPNDDELWNLELSRLDDWENSLTKIQRATAPEDGFEFDVALVNNHQLKGIALRHLQRHSEAIDCQLESLQQLEEYSETYGCKDDPGSAACFEIETLRRKAYRLLGTVYWDLGEAKNVVIHVAVGSASVQDAVRRLGGYVREGVAAGDFEKSMDLIQVAMDDFMKLEFDEELKSLCAMANFANRKLFNSISWIPGQDELRDEDPRDFADTYGLGIGKETKYGMADAEEDATTFATLSVTRGSFQRLEELAPPAVLESTAKEWGYDSVKALRRSLDIETFIRAQLAEGNLEPAAKYLYVTYIDVAFPTLGDERLVYRQPKEGELTFEDVQQAIDRLPASQGSQWTRQIIAQFESTYRFVQSRQPEPSETSDAEPPKSFDAPSKGGDQK